MITKRKSILSWVMALALIFGCFVGTDLSVKAAEEAKVIAVSASKTEIPSDGDMIELTIEGENLTADNWEITSAAYLKDVPEMSAPKAGKVTVLEQAADHATIEISANGMKNDILYVLTVGAKNGSEKKEVKITQGKKDYSTVAIDPKTVTFLEDGQTVEVSFKDNIQLAKEGKALKKLIYIANADGTGNKTTLSENDEVSADENTLTIKFAEPLAEGKVTNQSFLFVEEGALKTTDAAKTILQKFHWIITSNPKVSGISLEKDLFDSKGGTVRGTLTGNRLSEIKDSEYEVSVYLPSQTSASDIQVTKSRDAEKRPVISFDVPENRGTKTASYWLNIKFRNTPVYDDAASQRGAMTVVSVLAPGASKDDVTLSAISLGGNNSMDLSGGTGQLKSSLRLYGTNLSSKTEVRAIDENGIIFPVYHIGECDASIRFIAVAGVDKNGVFGSGNTQLIEVLPPKYVGSQNGKKTYTLQVALDGKNFIEDQSIQFTLSNESARGSADFTECDPKDYKYVDVKYVDESGKEIAKADQYHAYSISMVRQFDIAPKTIEGYELVKQPTQKQLEEDFIGNGKTYTYVYRSLNPAASEPVKQQSITLTGISKKIAAGKKIKLTPVLAENAKVTYAVSNSKYASVDANGVVTVKKAGAGKTVTITATTQDGSNAQATYTIKIEKHAVKSVKLKAAKTVKAGKSLKVKATVKTTGKKANKKLTWTSSNSSYATVSASGKVKTFKAGKGKKVKITAMATDGSGKKASVTIKIK